MSPRLDPGERPVCNVPNQRFEVGLRDRGGAGQLECSIPGVTISAVFGLPADDMRFVPPLRCPRCGGEEFHSDWGGGRLAPPEPLAIFVDKTFCMLPNTGVRTLGHAPELGIHELPASASAETWIDIELQLRASENGLEGRWYVESGDEELRALVIRELHVLLEARGSTGIVEDVVWSGIYLTEHRSAGSQGAQR